MTDQGRAYRVLTMNTLAFTVCFAAWTMNGVLITFLISNGIYDWDKAQVGWLIGIPVLTGSIMRLPVGVLTDKYGGRILYSLLILVSAVPMYLVSYANTYYAFLLAGLGFGLSGASFAVGIAYTSVWFKKEQQGTALGVFGVGNAGAALTSMGAPVLLRLLTNNGANLEAWRVLPQIYAAALAVTAVVFFFLTYSKKVEHNQEYTLLQRLAPLKHIQVWRFGLYYFLVFGGFVAMSQWLVPYYVNVYSMTVATAGFMAATFSLPAGMIRALGGWASDRWGPRGVLYLVFGAGIVLLILLLPPRMEIQAPGQGILTDRPGVVTSVTPQEIVVGQDSYRLYQPGDPGSPNVRVRFGIHSDDEGFLFLPTASFGQEPVVKVGQSVGKGQLLVRGITRIYFQANRWIFAGLVFLLGILMGIGSAAVYKHIPNYFPTNVGVVGGIVGVLGGLGGFVGPIVFGYLLKATGVWTTCWLLLAIVAVICLVWMHLVIRRMMRARVPVLIRQIEESPASE